MLVLLGALLGIASLGYPRTTLDSPASTYIGATILEGGAPDRDAWDLRAPGVYFTYAVNILLLGKSALALRCFDLLWQLLTALVLFRIAVLWLAERRLALLAAALYVSAYFSFHFSTWAQPDGYLNLALALSSLYCLKAVRSDRGWVWGAAAFAVGMAAIFKLTYGVFGLALVLAAVSGVRTPPTGRARRLAALAAGVTAAFLLCATYFYAKGALRDLLISQLRFAPAYVERIHAAMTFRAVLGTVGVPILIPFYALLLAGLGAAGSTLFRRESPPLPVWLLSAWLSVAAFSLFLQGSFLHYHFLPLLPPLALLGASGFAGANVKAHGGTPRHVRACAFLLSVFVLVSTVKLCKDARFFWNASTSVESQDTWRAPGLAIKQRTSPQERIFVWGNAPALYIHADRKAGCRFIATAFLAVDVPGVDYRRQCVEELRLSAPKYIVLVTQGPITPGLPGSLETYAAFPALKEFVAAHYSPRRPAHATSCTEEERRWSSVLCTNPFRVAPLLSKFAAQWPNWPGQAIENTGSSGDR